MKARSPISNFKQRKNATIFVPNDVTADKCEIYAELIWAISTTWYIFFSFKLLAKKNMYPQVCTTERGAKGKENSIHSNY